MENSILDYFFQKAIPVGYITGLAYPHGLYFPQAKYLACEESVNIYQNGNIFGFDSV